MVESDSLNSLLVLKGHIPEKLVSGVIYKFQYQFFGESRIKKPAGIFQDRE